MPTARADFAVGAAVAAAENAAPFGTPAAADQRADQPAAAHALRGYVDEASADRIKGWVWNPRQPQARIELELLDGEARLARVVANQYRSDLRDAGIGDGRYAFVIPLGEALLPQARHVLHLRWTETGAELTGAPIVIERTAATPPSEPAFYEPAVAYRPAMPPVVDDKALDAGRPQIGLVRHGAAIAVAPDRHNGPSGAAAAPEDGTVVEMPDGLQGTIDAADWTGIRGWIWDPRQPQRRIALELLDGDTPLATVVASDYRKDLEQAGIGDGRHGFAFSFSETLLPYARHVLHLRPVGSPVEVPSFPRVLTRERAGLDPTVQFILGNIVADAERAERVADLAPIITTLVSLLDATLLHYFRLVEQDAANPVNLLRSMEL
ncbi:MAG TPA: hypothetical protein VNF04_18960, partial [Stellaceae bacterium]|nr:hypothetical protein [Stellaceae bacterium]